MILYLFKLKMTSVSVGLSNAIAMYFRWEKTNLNTKIQNFHKTSNCCWNQMTHVMIWKVDGYPDIL